MIMEYQKKIIFLDSTPNQPSKFRTKNRLEVNDESKGTYNVISQIKFKLTMLKPGLCDYSDALLKKIQQLITQQLQMLMQIIQINIGKLMAIL